MILIIAFPVVHRDPMVVAEEDLQDYWMGWNILPLGHISMIAMSIDD